MAFGKAKQILLQKTKPHKRDKFQQAMLLLASAAALTALTLLSRYLISSQHLRQQQEELAAAYHQTTSLPSPSALVNSALLQEPRVVFSTSNPTNYLGDPLPETVVFERAAASDRFIPLMRRNNDVVGWLTYSAIPEMDFVVVHRDNTHYLYRSFTGEKNLAGTVFMEQDNQIRPRDANLILHGHNMADGTMFGKLARLLDPRFLQKDPFLQFDTLYQDTTYVPYALTIFSVDPDASNYFNVTMTAFPAPEDMVAYVNGLRAGSSLHFPTQVTTNDRLLTLVTCHGTDDNERLALALRAIRPGEDLKKLRSEMEQGITRP